MKILNVEMQMNVPNALSIVRLLLLPVFACLFLNDLVYWSFAVLALSGLTDLFDGIIARRFNQITPLGKILDPLADKVTQVAVVICLAIKYQPIIPLAIICFLKEAAQGVGGWLLLRRGVKPQGARWYGKISTFVFYGAMTAIVVFPDMSETLRLVLVLIVAVLMVFAFVRYFMEYLRIRREGVKE